MENKKTVQCYNRGCGQTYDPNENSEDSCRHHPGAPFFHDAYKGWTCCNKKCTDFTEFLNIKGCTVSNHSNVKPIEPEKVVLENHDLDKEVIEVKPMERPAIQRPSIHSPMVTIKPQITPSLNQQSQLPKSSEPNLKPSNKDGDIPVGTSCKNKGCTKTYESPQTNESTCIYHSGSPIFHEGMKYWSCCLKKTTDFNTFLNQVGCKEGKHVWIEEVYNGSCKAISA